MMWVRTDPGDVTAGAGRHDGHPRPSGLWQARDRRREAPREVRVRTRSAFSGPQGPGHSIVGGTDDRRPTKDYRPCRSVLVGRRSSIVRPAADDRMALTQAKRE